MLSIGQLHLNTSHDLQVACRSRRSPTNWVQNAHVTSFVDVGVFWFWWFRGLSEFFCFSSLNCSVGAIFPGFLSAWSVSVFPLSRFLGLAFSVLRSACFGFPGVSRRKNCWCSFGADLIRSVREFLTQPEGSSSRRYRVGAVSQFTHRRTSPEAHERIGKQWQVTLQLSVISRSPNEHTIRLHLKPALTEG